MNDADIQLTILAPCFNEEGNIAELVRRIAGCRDRLPAFELVLVDDGSRDGTWREIQKAREQYPFVVPVRHVGNLGLVAGWRSGLAASRGRLVVTIDADLQYRPEDIALLLEKMRDADVDLVQGAREVEVQRSALRRTLTAGFSRVLNSLFGMKLKDNKSGFILYRRDVMADVLATRFRYRFFQHFVTVAAHAKGYRIAQTLVIFDPRHSGESYIRRPVRFALRSLRDLPFALWEFRLAKRGRIA
jgi:phenylacetate-CoA ligase